MKYVGMAEIGLGYTRIAGLLVHDIVNRSFIEITPAAARKLIASKDLVAVKWDEEAEHFVGDPEWNASELLLKTGCGKFTRRVVKDETVNNSVYAVIKVCDTDEQRLYTIISNICQILTVPEQVIRELSPITQVAGVRVNADNIQILDGVEYEDRRTVKTEEKNIAKKPATDNAKKKQFTGKKINREKR